MLIYYIILLGAIVMAWNEWRVRNYPTLRFRFGEWSAFVQRPHRCVNNSSIPIWNGLEKRVYWDGDNGDISQPGVLWHIVELGPLHIEIAKGLMAYDDYRKKYKRR